MYIYFFKEKVRKENDDINLNFSFEFNQSMENMEREGTCSHFEDTDNKNEVSQQFCLIMINIQGHSQ